MINPLDPAQRAIAIIGMLLRGKQLVLPGRGGKVAMSEDKSIGLVYIDMLDGSEVIMGDMTFKDIVGLVEKYDIWPLPI